MTSQADIRDATQARTPGRRQPPGGRLTQDPGVMPDPDLRRPVNETSCWLRTGSAGSSRKDAREELGA